MRRYEYRGKHAGSPGTGNRPPWMTHPRKRGMPKFVRNLLILLLILALAALGYCVYLLLNPDVARTATIS